VKTNDVPNKDIISPMRICFASMLELWYHDKNITTALTIDIGQYIIAAFFMSSLKKILIVEKKRIP
tara:strand:- start:45 stop:242 length:198 start_codon:yes stop_codon:yes gene_type:complete